MLHLLPAILGTASGALGAVLMGSSFRAAWQRAREWRAGATTVDKARLRWGALQRTGKQRFRRQTAMGLLGHALVLNALYVVVVPGILPDPPGGEIALAMLGLTIAVAVVASAGGWFLGTLLWLMLERRHRERGVFTGLA